MDSNSDSDKNETSLKEGFDNSIPKIVFQDNAIDKRMQKIKPMLRMIKMEHVRLKNAIKNKFWKLVMVQHFGAQRFNRFLEMT